ncbi:MAG: excinuclease ABC subunit UvrA [Thermoplasmatota archaeon]
MSEGRIVIKGARQHNLKSIDVSIPRNELVVITGLSGSGKSSLAFDTIYAEGQRRFIESLSSYARQFLGVMDKPDVDSIEGLSPSISIEQHAPSKNPRSTVATTTEIHDHLRLLFARIGIPHCPVCSREIERQSQDQILHAIMEGGAREIRILAPIELGRKGTHKDTLIDLKRQGFLNFRVDGKDLKLGDVPELDKNKKHDILVILDSLISDEEHRDQLTEDVSQALGLSDGRVIVEEVEVEGIEQRFFSERMSCPVHNISIPDLEPRMFSFNSPFGACKECSGLGTILDVDPDLVIPDPGKSISGGAIGLFKTDPEGSYSLRMLEALGREMGFSINTPWKDMSEWVRESILYGTEKAYSIRITSETYDWRHKRRYEGLIPTIKRRYQQTQSEMAREFYRRFMRATPCPACGGSRMKPSSLAVTVGGLNIHEVLQLSIRDSLSFFEGLEDELSEKEKLIGKQVLKEIRNRLTFLRNVGLDYLTLDRATGTLSGGEAQRIQLATQIGSSLVGVLYVLDEPSIGLHQRDNHRLIRTLVELRDLGNTIIVVEHDEQVIRSSDHIIDLGPGAGAHGGNIVGQGTVEDICSSEMSITGQYLSGNKHIPVPKDRRKGNGKKLTIRGASHHNLKNIDITFPLGTFLCVTGVSGSGKSTLVEDILYRGLKRHLYNSTDPVGSHDSIEGLEHIDKAIVIDQSPIGRTPRSNPTTYTGAFTPIREIFSRTTLSKMRGYKPGQFSFNVRGGRCQNCEGDGIIKLEMHFLPDVYIPCEVCKGKRYTDETLEIKFKGKSISDVLNMSVEEALKFFENIPKIKRKLKTLSDVGLGYIKLGQPAPTLSGGEAQRVKLATELSKRATGKTIYLLDEPTTGLHFDDVSKLLKVLLELREKGNTVVVIEHNLDVIKTADWIIDLGPEGGDEGGMIVAKGTPEMVAKDKKSYTGSYLKGELKRISKGCERIKIS